MFSSLVKRAFIYNLFYKLILFVFCHFDLIFNMA
jgi:hypothetical protein